jgi:hypothetical protein
VFSNEFSWMNSKDVQFELRLTKSAVATEGGEQQGTLWAPEARSGPGHEGGLAGDEGDRPAQLSQINTAEGAPVQAQPQGAQGVVQALHEPEPEAEPEPRAEAGSAAEGEVEPEVGLEMQPEQQQPGPQPEDKTHVDSDSQPAEPEAEPQPESKPEAEADLMAEPMAEPMAEQGPALELLLPKASEQNPEPEPESGGNPALVRTGSSPHPRGPEPEPTPAPAAEAAYTGSYVTCLDRPYVQKEIRWAQQYKKKIIVIFEKEVPGTNSIQNLFSCCKIGSITRPGLVPCAAT